MKLRAPSNQGETGQGSNPRSPDGGSERKAEFGGLVRTVLTSRIIIEIREHVSNSGGGSEMERTLQSY